PRRGAERRRHRHARRARRGPAPRPRARRLHGAHPRAQDPGADGGDAGDGKASAQLMVFSPPRHQDTKMSGPIPPNGALERIGREVVDSAFKVHAGLGPGLLESVYQTCLQNELVKRNLAVSREVAIPIVYDGISLDGGLRLDLVVEDEVIVELKAVDRLLP